MTNIKDLPAEKQAKLNAIIAKAEANVEAKKLQAEVEAPAPAPATVIPNKTSPAKRIGKKIVDSISVITVPMPPVKTVATTKPAEVEIVEGPAPYTKAKAENLDKRITATIGRIGDSLETLEGLVKEAKEGQIHIALGFPSWTAYFADRVSTPFAAIGDRQVAALMLHEEGMSNRAIAATLNVSPGTVVTDVKAAKAKQPTATQAKAPAKTVGKDGKTYKRPEPKKAAPQPKTTTAKPAPKPKHSPLAIRTDLALADAENLVADIESLITNLEALYATPEFVAGGDKEIKAHITKARKLLGSLPAAPTRRKPAAKEA